MKKYALVFSGQGSERVGMFNDMLKEPTALNQVLDGLKDQLDIDLGDAVATKDAAVVAKNNQLLLSVYHHLMARTLVGKIGYPPAFCMGHSFGQFSALVSAGAASFTDMASFINKRAKTIHCDSVKVRASFKSIHGMTLEDFEGFVTAEGLAGQVELALHNQKAQVVCAATPEGEERLAALGQKYNYVLKDVPVSRPYHTSFMDEYNQKLEPHIRGMAYHAPMRPVVLNHSKQAVTDRGLIRDEALIQMTKPVFWYDSVMNVADEVDAFVIIDPGETQSKMLRRMTDKKIHNANNLGAVKMIEKRGV